VNVIDGAIDGEPPPDGLSVQLEQDLHGIPIKTIDEWFFPSKRPFMGDDQWEIHGKIHGKIIIYGGFPS